MWTSLMFLHEINQTHSLAENETKCFSLHIFVISSVQDEYINPSNFYSGKGTIRYFFEIAKVCAPRWTWWWWWYINPYSMFLSLRELYCIGVNVTGENWKTFYSDTSLPLWRCCELKIIILSELKKSVLFKDLSHFIVTIHCYLCFRDV